ncbi:MAG: hypothetical protein HEQ23_00105 [Tepidisphaera sp.]
MTKENDQTLVGAERIIEHKSLPKGEVSPAQPGVALKELIRNEFERGMTWQKCAWVCDLTTIVLAIVPVLVDHFSSWRLLPGTQLAIAVSAALLSFVRWAFMNRSRECKEVADRVRRVELLASSAGVKVPEREIVNMLEPFETIPSVGEILKQISVERLPERGMGLLAQRLQSRAQRAKFTYHKHARLCWMILGVSMIGLVFVLYLSLVTQSTEMSTAMAKLVPIILGFDAARTLLACALRFSQSGKEMALFEASISGRDLSKTEAAPEVVMLFADYNSIVERTPLTLSSIYFPIKRKIVGEPRK